jgi:hypothetical protein
MYEVKLWLAKATSYFEYNDYNYTTVPLTGYSTDTRPIADYDNDRNYW